MTAEERDVDTWKAVVYELEQLLEYNDGRTHGRLVRSWLVDQQLKITELEGDS